MHTIKYQEQEKEKTAVIVDMTSQKKVTVDMTSEKSPGKPHCDVTDDWSDDEDIPMTSVPEGNPVTRGIVLLHRWAGGVGRRVTSLTKGYLCRGVLLLLYLAYVVWALTLE